MMKEYLKKGLCFVALFLQAISLIGVGILQFLSDKKAGIMHHIYYKRYEYESSWMSEVELQKYMIIAVIIGVILVLYSIKRYKDNSKKLSMNRLYVLNIMIFLLAYTFKSQFLKSFLAYPYFLIVFIFVILIQGIMVYLD